MQDKKNCQSTYFVADTCVLTDNLTCQPVEMCYMHVCYELK